MLSYTRHKGFVLCIDAEDLDVAMVSNWRNSQLAIDHMQSHLCYSVNLSLVNLLCQHMYVVIYHAQNYTIDPNALNSCHEQSGKVK